MAFLKLQTRICLIRSKLDPRHSEMYHLRHHAKWQFPSYKFNIESLEMLCVADLNKNKKAAIEIK